MSKDKSYGEEFATVRTSFERDNQSGAMKIVSRLGDAKIKMTTKDWEDADALSTIVASMPQILESVYEAVQSAEKEGGKA